MPESSPSEAGTQRMPVAAPGSVYRWAISQIRSMNESPRAPVTPPPITTTSGLSRLTTPPIAAPSARAASSISCTATGSSRR